MVETSHATLVELPTALGPISFALRRVILLLVSLDPRVERGVSPVLSR